MKSDYNFWFQEGVLIIQDTATKGSAATSVTNNMEAILEDIEKITSKSLENAPIIYRDSVLNYDGVTWRNRRVGFVALREPDFKIALNEAKGWLKT